MELKFDFRYIQNLVLQLYSMQTSESHRTNNLKKLPKLKTIARGDLIRRFLKNIGCVKRESLIHKLEVKQNLKYLYNLLRAKLNACDDQRQGTRVSFCFSLNRA